jgi:hypothetical protein
MMKYVFTSVYSCDQREGQLVSLVLMARLEKKSMSSPDETRTFDKGKIELIKIGDANIGRIYLEPGWSWEKCVKPIVRTESCQVTHRQYVMSAHNAWVVGNEPYTGIDFGTVDMFSKNYVAAP